MDASSPRPILATLEREFFFEDAVHKGFWEKAGVELCRKTGVEIDFSRRSPPPASVRLKEWAKGAIFRAFPADAIVRVQNRFNLGAR